MPAAIRQVLSQEMLIRAEGKPSALCCGERHEEKSI